MARRCRRAGNKVIFATELDAKIALAGRVWKDKGEKRYYSCRGHFHLTSMEEGFNDPLLTPRVGSGKIDTLTEEDT